jgi:C4-type Zn-finger protein
MPNLLTPTETELKKIYGKEYKSPYFTSRVQLFRMVCQDCGYDTDLDFIDKTDKKRLQHTKTEKHYLFHVFRLTIDPEKTEVTRNSWEETY